MSGGEERIGHDATPIDDDGARAPWGAWLVVAIAVIFGLALLWPEIVASPPPRNDRVAHEAIVASAAAGGQWIVNPWFPSIGAGFPVFAHYPHLSHLVGASVTRALPGDVDARRVYGVLNALLLAAMPLVVFVSARRLGVSAAGAACAAVIYPLIRSDPKLGIGWGAYLYSGSGMMPQLWGVAFAFAALGWGWRTLSDEDGPVGAPWAAGVLLGGAAVSHSIFGYVAAVSLVLAVPFVRRPGPSVVGRAVRLAALAGVTFLATAYFVVPFVRYLPNVLKSQWEPAWKYDSIGFTAFAHTFNGRMFDGGDLPVLTAVVGLAWVWVIVRAVRRWDARAAWVVAASALWLVLYAGRAAWGGLVDVLPFASGLPMHRFAGGVQIFGVFAVAIAASDLFDGVRARAGRRAWPAVVGIAAVVASVLLVPTVRRFGDAVENAALVADRVQAVSASPAGRVASRVIEALRELPPGRVHAGGHDDWGRRFAVGGVEMYAVLQRADFDMVALPFIAMSKPAEWQIRASFDRLVPSEIYNVRWWVAPDAIPAPLAATVRERVAGVTVYEMPTSGYFGIGRVETDPDTPLADAEWEDVYEAGVSWIRGFELEDPKWRVVGSGPEPLATKPLGAIVHEATAPGRFEARVRLETAADVVLKATYHPLWRATVDGEPAEITHVLPSYPAIRVPPGEHVVSFAFSPPAWQKALFGVALLTVVWGPARAIVSRVRRARTGAVE